MTREEVVNYYWDHYPLGFTPIEDVVGPEMHYVVDKSEEKEKEE